MIERRWESKVTCKEAAELQRTEPGVIAWYRPNGPDLPPFSDDDEAFVTRG